MHQAHSDSPTGSTSVTSDPCTTAKVKEKTLVEPAEKGAPKLSDFAMLASDDGWAFHSSVYE